MTLIGWGLLGTAFAAELQLTPEAPVEGQPVTVRAVGASPQATLTVTSRPGSVLEETAPLALTRGEASWTPASPGLAILSLTDGEATVTRKLSVRFDGPPPSGVAVFLLAGGLLFGGIAAGFRLLMRGHEEEGLPLSDAPIDV
ncbi:MAG: hypothetical protein H6739_33235 [Alphaproteobacteria bacterium]|nr:hypothetical protein [Alphaproteobacteria bacterium]